MEMDKLKIVIHPSEYEQLVKGNIDSLFIILHKSNNELHDLTHLPLDVIETIKTKAVDIVCNKKFITGTVYICTEDVFPSKRFHQLSDSFKSRYNLQELDFETSVYLDHSADFEQLRRCLCVRLPRLLQVKNIGLLVIDSIAGIFRSENNDICYTSRGQEIGLLASTLHRICDQYKIAVVCVNQVLPRS
ncbi:hypothetical protein NQ315_016313 [Exocentrus adspersus]|uniref:Rad51-like C-terminal domain-containing protein n=1 Tax=Exocentrus adspersus TaxID=1586481 RepID=A0AAV8VPV5_9CUCU|nr:hypothetical protein NQ315_016313 [Exocentrus adspersus]